MKRFLVVIMVLTVALCFFGCGGAKDNKAATGTEGKGTAAPTTEPSATTTTPATSTTSPAAPKLTEEQIGVKYYPGSQIVANETVTHPSDIITDVYLNTTDPLAKVVEFYKKELKRGPDESIHPENPEWSGIKVSDKITNKVSLADKGSIREIHIEHWVTK